MKRFNRKGSDIISDLQAKGMTKKQIADAIGVKPRTLNSYKAYFGGYRKNKNHRTPPPERIKALKQLAHKKRVRTTKALNEKKLYEVYLKYSIKMQSTDKTEKPFTQKRDKLLHFAGFEFTEKSKEKLIQQTKQELKKIYSDYNLTVLKIDITYFQVRNSTNF